MKKMILLSVAMITGLVILTSVQKVCAIEVQPSVTMVLEDDGFVDVKLQDLGEAVQVAVNAFAREYDATALKYNAEKQLTKVILVKKDDQSEKVVYLDAEGKETLPAAAPKEEQKQEVEETPKSL
jgi:hypothetical protein